MIGSLIVGAKLLSTLVANQRLGRAVLCDFGYGRLVGVIFIVIIRSARLKFFQGLVLVLL
jgi:hypothetical protein